MEENNKSLYVKMFLGTIGVVLVGLGALRYLAIMNDTKGYLFTFLGFLLTINYIYYLEKKAGISTKITWIKAAISIILLAIMFNFL